MFETLSGTAVSRFSFGTMQFGGGADEAASGEMYRASREAGINFFDTAYLYAEGASEEILGRLMAEDRDEIFLATKCGYDAASPKAIAAEFSASRKRLGCDVVDLLYLHRWDAETPLEESFGALARYVQDGVVRHLGVSNFAAWQVMKAQTVARDMGLRIDFVQPMYNLVKRQVEVEILPMAASEGLAVCPYSPLGGGLLTGKYAAGGTGRLHEEAFYASRYRAPWMHETASALPELAGEMSVNPATLAVAWVARHENIWGPIVSARSVAQLAPSLAAIGFEMDAALYEQMSALSVAPPPATDRSELP